ncbi:MAG: hypothetical protein SXV54_10195 [Chloroflexota bacterium]|nr:hypothetical protein [Chloroflexota bacterium]
MSDFVWIVLLVIAAGCIFYLGIQLYISRRVVKTLQQTAIVVTPPAKSRSRTGVWLLQAVLVGGTILAALNLLLK